MLSEIFQFISNFEWVIWSYVGFPIILFLGLYLSLKSGFVQLRSFPSICRYFFTSVLSESRSEQDPSTTSVSPIKAFFASVGGCLGIGNIVAITMAVQIGGPGALLWVWCAAIFGSLIKYSEVLIGIKTRQMTTDGPRGGPMYFLRQATGGKWLAGIFCVLMAIYGVEIYQFSVVADVGAQALCLDKFTVACLLLAMVLYAEIGGISRIGAISSFLVPVFLGSYLIMGVVVFLTHIDRLPFILIDIFSSAFTSRAVEGAFIGSTLMTTISQGVQRGCYSSDIGVGYASIIHSQSSERVPERQASLLIFEIFMDTFIVCTMSVVLVLLTGVWKENIASPQLVQTALSTCFPYTEYFMPLFLFLLGYTTIITYFSAGMNTIEHIMPRYGRLVYYLYSISAFLIFSFFETNHAISVMSCVQFGLLLINSFGIWRLRHLVSFDMTSLHEVPKKEPTTIAPLESS